MAGGKKELREGFAGYDVVKAAPSYSNVVGLLSGFALTAVVLAITVAGTAHLHDQQQFDVGFATTMFAVAFLGCLACAFSMASIAGEKNSPATLTCSMLVGSGIAVCFITVLVGFAALAHAFLPDSAPAFLAVCFVGVVIAPPFVWFPQWDIVRNFGEAPYPGPPRSTEEAKRLVVGLFMLGVFTALVGLGIRLTGVIGTAHHWEVLALALVTLIYTAAMVLAALLVSTWMNRPRLGVRMTWALGLIQSATVLALICLVPA